MYNRNGLSYVVGKFKFSSAWCTIAHLWGFIYICYMNNKITAFVAPDGLESNSTKGLVVGSKSNVKFVISLQKLFLNYTATVAP